MMTAAEDLAYRVQKIRGEAEDHISIATRADAYADLIDDFPPTKRRRQEAAVYRRTAAARRDLAAALRDLAVLLESP